MSPGFHAVIDDENPWPGLGAFDETAERFFNGRGTESAALRRLVGHAPLTVLFGTSGLGKTSLLQAGLFPLLRKEHFLPVYVRVDVRARSAPLIHQLQDALEQQFKERQIEAPGIAGAESLWAYLHGANLELWSGQNQLLTPVFVLDQFEELFTLGVENPDAIARFSVDLADLIENRMPADLAQSSVQNEAAGSALSLDRQPYKLILSFREDFLPVVEGLKHEIPSILRNRLRLLPMSGEQAFQAVYETGSRLVDEPLARDIVRFVAAVQPDGNPGEPGRDAIRNLAVEPALLSLVCHGLNEKRKAQKKPAFDAELLSGTGQAVIFEYYRDAVADLPKRVHRLIQDELITERGFRKTCDVDDAARVHGVTAAEQRLLIDRRLLRKEFQRGTEQVELTHDLLTGVVREHRDRQREQARRWRMASLAAVGVVMTALVVVFASLYFEARTQRREADTQRQLAVDERTAADKARDFAVTARGRAETAVSEKEKAAADLKSQKDIAEQLATTATLARGEAERQAAIAAARRLATESLYRFEGASDDLAVSGALAALSLKMEPTSEGMKALSQVLRLTPLAPQMIPKAHARSVRALAFSRDGRRLASAAEDRTVALWDLADRMKKTPLEMRATTAPSGFGLAFSPDGQWLAGGAMGSLWIWNTATGAAQEPIEHDGLVRSTSFSPDGRRLATASRDTGAVRIFENAGDRWNELPPPTWTAGKYRANSAAFVTNTLLALAGNYGTPRHGVWFWDLDQKKEAFLVPGNADENFGECRALRVSREAGHLTALCARGIFVAEREQPTFRASGTSHEDSHSFSASHGLAITDDGRYIAAAGNSGIVSMFGSPDEQEVTRMAMPASSVAFGSDGKTLAAGLNDGSIALWPTTRGVASIRVPLPGRIRALAFSPDERWLVTAGQDETVRVLDVSAADRSREIQSWQIGPGLGQPVFSPDGGLVVIPGQSAVHVIGTRPWKRLPKADLPGTVRLTTFSPSGRLLITLNGQGIQRFDTTTWKQVMPALPGEFQRVRFSPDGRWIGAFGNRTGSGRSRIRSQEVWNLATGESVAWHEEGRPPGDGRSRPPTGGRQALIADLEHWKDAVQPSVAPGGLWQFSIRQQTLTIEEGDPRRTVARFEHDADVVSAGFSPRGRWLASASEDNMLRLWPLQAGGLLDQACRLLPRNLTPAEWKELNVAGPYQKMCPNLP